MIGVNAPIWGYLLAGRMTVRYADHEEVINAVEVYYMAPGHTMAALAGTVLIEFSPKEEFRKLTEIAEKNFARITKGVLSYHLAHGVGVTKIRTLPLR